MSGQKTKHKVKSAGTLAIDAVAGGASGALEILFTYPFEFAKTQKQLYPKTWGQHSVIGCWKEIVKNKGFTALYRGMPPLIVFGIPRNGARFSAAEVTKSYLASRNPDIGLIKLNMISGLAGGISEAVLITTIQETMKVRLVHDRLSEKPRFKGTIHGITTICKEQGFRGIYRGLVPTMAKQGSNQMIRFPVYYSLKSLLCEDVEKDFSQNGIILGNIQQLAVGGMAGACSVLGNTPIDVVKTKLQGLESNKYNGVIDCCKKIYQQNGFKGFYSGMGARMGRVVSDVALTFFFMEKVKLLIKNMLKTS